jgi:penicillin-insensitive murein endopeptidase
VEASCAVRCVVSSGLLPSLLPALLMLLGAIAWAQPPGGGSEDGAAVEARSPRRRARAAGSGRRTRGSAREAERSDPSSVSVGRHNRGRLVHGAELFEGEHLRFKSADTDHHHGTDELVAALHAAADRVWERLPGARLTVGDLSRPAGGRFRPHRSHQSGRDVDVGFYIVDLEGDPVEARRFMDFGPMGTTRREPSWRFDDARNWTLVAHLLTQTDAPVQYLFVSRELRRRLLAEGARQGAEPELLARASEVLYQPPRGGRHRDHFHLRVYCDARDLPRCRDDGPHHPWLRGSSALAEAERRGRTGLEDVVEASAWFSAPPPEAAPEGEAERSEGMRARRARPRRRARRGH